MLILLIAGVTLNVVAIAVMLWLATHRPSVDLSPIVARLESAERTSERLERGLRDDLGRQREELRVQLAAVRSTVDEQLQGTLERRLGESFSLVSERLEQVHKGLGEMQTLAAGVGDLKKVLMNVKVRGTWGEVQLGGLLEQLLIPAQYAKNVCTTGQGAERVEFAIKLPGRDPAGAAQVWLPIDAKFPQEDYIRLVDASEAADVAGIELAGKALENRVRQCARDIATKYVCPPATTDFALMFLPTEGLYAEVLRRPGLAEMVQRDHRVIIAGPTTLAALLNSLQMGFRTLAIEQRSSEVWTVLGEAKTEFRRYGDVLDRIKGKLQEATSAVDTAAVRTRAIERRLRGVEETQ
jgi:DNA recombination protein RmuC